MTEILLVGFGLLCVLPCVGLLFSRNLVASFFLLLGSLLGVAAMYIFAGAEFLAVSQIILYVGGIMIVLLFGVLLTHKSRELNPYSELVNIIPSILVLVGTGVLMYLVVTSYSSSELLTRSVDLNPISESATKLIGTQLLTTYLLPFEFVSILLLVALIGGVVVVSGRKEQRL